jgi:hypothetical protein
MHDAPWQDEVARLLEQAAQALRDKADRRAVRAFGTAIAYLELAGESGDKVASEILAQAVASFKEGPTERFTFQPGELEALSVRGHLGDREAPEEPEEPEAPEEPKPERTRSSRKKKR